MIVTNPTKLGYLISIIGHILGFFSFFYFAAFFIFSIPPNDALIDLVEKGKTTQPVFMEDGEVLQLKPGGYPGYAKTLEYYYRVGDNKYFGEYALSLVGYRNPEGVRVYYDPHNPGVHQVNAGSRLNYERLSYRKPEHLIISVLSSVLSRLLLVLTAIPLLTGNRALPRREGIFKHPGPEFSS